MKFKPTLWKTIVSIAVTIVWYFLLVLEFMSRISGKCLPCVKYEIPSLFSDNCGCGVNLLQIILQIIIILIPGIIVYLGWSSRQKNKSLSKKKR